jgi:hypothetical protein
MPGARRVTARTIAVVMVLAALAAGCGSGSAPTGTPGRGTPAGQATQVPTKTAAAAATELSIPDLCGLVGAAAVTAAIGEPVTAGVTQNATGSSTCTLSAASGTKVALSVTAGFSSLSGWDFQMRTLGYTDANKIPGIGEAAYGKASLPLGGAGASFSAYSNHTGVDVSIASTADANALLAAATAIGKLLFEAVV